MPLPALFLPFLAAAAQAAPAEPIVVTGHSGVSFISPMGEPFRARTATDDALARWFGQADRNQDGMLIADEMQADADRFFATLDTTPDAQILPEELVQYEWEVAPEIQVNARLRRPRSASADEPEQPPRRADRGRREQPYDPHALQGAARYALLNIPQPVAAADADLDRAVTLDEFRRAAQARFQLLDGQRQGRLTLAGLKAMLPKLPPPGKRAKRRTDQADTRIGVPLPAGD